MAAILEDFLNAGLDPDQIPPWDLRSVRYINLSILVMVCIGLSYIPVYLRWGLPLSAAAMGVAAPAAAGLALSFRRSRRVARTAHLAMLLLYAPIAVALWETGGLYSVANAWLLVLPMLGGLLGGLGCGVLWALITGLTLSAAWLAHTLGAPMPQRLPDPLYLNQSLFGLLGALIATAGISLGFIHQSRAAQARTERTIEALQQEIACRREAERRAREELETRARFLAMMSHEIRTPMNGVLGMNQLLVETGLDREQLELATTALSAGRSLLRLLDEILDFSKLEAGRVRIEAIPFQLPALLHEVGGLYRATAWDKGLEISLSLSAALPEWVEGDPTRLRQVLLNLLNNAVKFTSAGEILLSAELLDGGRVRFAVRDTGIGISEGAQATLFEAFTQAEASTTRRYGGTGLGLAICAQLVELMGGELGLESAVGEGSTFSFDLSLPAAEAPEPVAQVAAARSVRVLLAEDNPVNQKLAVRLLAKCGHRVDVVDNGRKAVEILASGRAYDLVLMDVQMPEMGGLEATRRIRELPGPASQIPIIALTASALAEDRERCAAAGMDDFLTKPYDLEAFRGALARFAGPRAA